MKKNKSLVVGVLVLALLILSIGYAAITTISFVVIGTNHATPKYGKFKVVFASAPFVDNSKTVGENVIAGGKIDPNDRTKASIDVSGMSEENDSITVKIPIKNESTDLSASLTALVTHNSNQEYFDITSSLEDASIAPNGATNLVVKVTLKKEPIEESESGTFMIGLSAVPIQPKK